MSAADTGSICQHCKRQFGEDERFCPFDGSPLAPERRAAVPAAEPPPVRLPPAPAADRRHATDEVDPLVGRTLAGRYLIESAIGSGGMSTVYLARHAMLDRALALKILKRDLPPTSRAADRFRREARVASRIEHENVVFLTDFGVTEDGLLFMVMEYVQGPGLHQVIQDVRGMPWGRAAHLTLQVARALQAAHGVGIVHRDLKPENLVIVDPGGRDHVKVLDFGIAKLVEAEGPISNLTRAGMVFGTPEYMSPEHAQGLPLDGRTDLYALGLILWECLVGRRAIQGRSAPMTMALQLSHDPGPPSRSAGADAGIPKALDDLVMRLIAKNPDDRFHKAADVVDALEASLQRDATPAPAPTPPPADGTAASPGGRRRTGSVTMVDQNLADKVKSLFGKKKRRPARPAREAAIRDLAEALWPEGGPRPPHVARAIEAFEAADEAVVDTETDLAWVEDEVARLRGAVAGPPDDDGVLHDTALRAEMLRGRIDRLARSREAALMTVALLVMSARPGAPDLADDFAALDALNIEVALAGPSGGTLH